MNIETDERRDKILELREELLSVEEDRAAGAIGISINELDAYLNQIIINACRDI